MINKRKDVARIGIVLDVLFRLFKSESEYFSGRTQEVSVGGLSFETSFGDLKLKDLLELKITLQQKNETFQFTGEVVWIKQIGNKWRIGVKIQEMDERFKKEIASHQDMIWKDVRRLRQGL
jgi:hypothetical protein